MAGRFALWVPGFYRRRDDSIFYLRNAVCSGTTQPTMRMKRIVRVLLFAGMLALGAGCSNSEPGLPSEQGQPYVPSADTIARVHWLGEDRLGVAASASVLMRLWQLPASANLQAQTLDRLAAVPGRWWAGDTTATNVVQALVRSLLDDIVWDESYLEIRRPANQPAEFAFAIRLDTVHAGIWETNLASILESLTGPRSAALSNGRQGWSFRKPGAPDVIKLIRAGEWTIVSRAPDDRALLDGILDWIRHDPVPAIGVGTNDWLEADLDFQQLATVLPSMWNLPANLPKMSLAINGDGANVLEHGKLTFPQPLPLQLEAWNFPTNVIREPLDSLTAVRGLHPWLPSLKIWHDLPLGAPPGQLFFWSLPGMASQVYFAAPLPEASNQVNCLAEYLMAKANPWLAGHGYVTFERLPESNGVMLGNLSSIQPFLRFVDATNGDVAFGGLLLNTDPGTNTQDNLFERPLLSGLFDHISAQTNLVYYDWELTGSRIEPCLYLGQALRVVSHHAQLPLESDSLECLRLIEPRLGICTTIVTRTGTNQLSFFRKSTVGFTGAELQLLADWLESPQFPTGLYSLLTPSPTQP
jgi:hypothetical protein